MKYIDEKQINAIHCGLGIIHAAAAMTNDETLEALLKDALELIGGALGKSDGV